MKRSIIQKLYISVMIIITLVNLGIVPRTFAMSRTHKYILEAKNFVKTGNEMKIDQTDVEEIQVDVYSLLFHVGILVAVLITAVLGVQFMLSAPEGRADIKKQLVIFVVGCIVVFGSLSIWRMSVRLIQNAAS